MSIDIPSPSFGFQQDQRTSFSSTAVVRQQCPVNEINQDNNKEQQQLLRIGNKVDYLILVCKNAETYSKQLLKKTVHDSRREEPDGSISRHIQGSYKASQ